MSTSAELSRYETKPVIVHANTEMPPRRRSLPTHVGPWPVKRSQSETNYGKKLSFSDFGDSWEESRAKPTLGSVLRQIDEECASIDNMVEKELALTSPKGTSRSSSEEDREQRKPAPVVKMERTRANVLLALLLLALFVGFVWPPIMTFMFGNRKFGKVMLPSQAPSVTVLGVMLVVPIMLVSMGLTMSIYAINEFKNQRNMFQEGQRGMWVGVVGILVGIIMNVWVMIWVQPLLGHE